MKNIKGFIRGARVHINIIIVREIDGPAINTIILPFINLEGSLRINLIASEKGCGIPIKLTLLGPLRSCKRPNNFRSNKVKNAIEIKVVAIINVISIRIYSDVKLI